VDRGTRRTRFAAALDVACRKAGFTRPSLAAVLEALMRQAALVLGEANASGGGAAAAAMPRSAASAPDAGAPSAVTGASPGTSA
jgi:hypothetical protein